MATKRDINKTVQGLLDKAADSAATEQESQALYAKAAELMLKHGLDAATLRAEKKQKPEDVGIWNFTVSGQGWHGKGRAALAFIVGEAYGCKAVTYGNKMNGNDRIVCFMGTTSALAALEVLLPSIMTQAELSNAVATDEYMKTQTHLTNEKGARGIARRVFYRSYFGGYGEGVADKILAARGTVAEEVKGKPGELVLVSDEKRVLDAYNEMFPKLKATAPDKRSFEGRMTGQRDGRAADIGDKKVSTKKPSTVGAKKTTTK